MRPLTVADYLTLGEDNPAFRHSELIRGIIVGKMSKTTLHIYLTENIREDLREEVRGGFFVRQEASLRLTDSMPEPAAAVLRGTRKEFRDRYATTADLVVEVAVTSLALDRAKASLYAEADVAEYWVVLAEAEQIEAYHRPVNGFYQETHTY